MHEVEMQEVPRSDVRRRDLLDGGFALSLLTLAIVAGYVTLAPSASRAKTVATSPARPSTEPRPVNAITMGAPTAPELPRDVTSSPAPGTSPSRTRTATLTPSLTPAPSSIPAPTGVPAPQPAVVGPAPTWPGSTITGRVLDGKRESVAGASVVLDGREIRTPADGMFTIERPTPTAPLLVKMPGYEKVTVTPAPGPIEVVLKPKTIKAAYLTYFGVGDRGIRGRLIDLLARTELNAVVIDVKGDRGWILYRTEVPMALTVGAQGPATLKDFDGLMADLKARGVYTIARIVTFKDNILSNARPDLAIVDTRTGKPWIDNEKLAWVDPFREEVWDYNIAIAKEAIRHGFDEVQFDYVRFPTDGRLSAAKYSRENNKDTRLPTVAGFLAKARRELGPLGAFVAADVFGYTAFNENDTDIGQRIEELAPHLDYVCPMVYPSGYHRGIPGYRNPVEHPYEVVHESVRLIRKRSANTVVRVRPWIQDFKDYAYDRRIFGVPEIRAQVKGADDAGAVGWMLWNPRNDYTGSALRQKGALPVSSSPPPTSTTSTVAASN